MSREQTDLPPQTYFFTNRTPNTAPVSRMAMTIAMIGAVCEVDLSVCGLQRYRVNNGAQVFEV